MFIRKIQFLILVGMLILLFMPTAFGIYDDLEREYISCFINQPDKKELRERLRNTLEKSKNTEIEDDVLLALAEVENSLGNTVESERLFDLVKSMTKAKKIDTSYLWRGLIEEEEMALIQDIQVYYKDKSPDFTSDYAFLDLAKIYQSRGELKKSLDTLEELRKKYPQGDRADEDVNFIETFVKKHTEIYARADGQVPILFTVSQFFKPRRRPHFRGLCVQELLLRTQGNDSQKLIEILYDIVRLYEPLLTTKELNAYCNEGLTQIEKLSGDKKFAEMQKTFSKALSNKHNIFNIGDKKEATKTLPTEKENVPNNIRKKTNIEPTSNEAKPIKGKKGWKLKKTSDTGM